MNKIKLGIIREGKIPVDKRVPFTPIQAKEIKEKFPHVDVVCQQSDVRCFANEEYKAQGIEIVSDVSDCDILMGIKEVPVSNLLDKKVYLFFSHTMKKQPYNRPLLQAVLKKKIQLIDYEALKNKKGDRLVAFGRYAGIVGTYNGLWTFGKRYKAYTLRRAFECFDVDDLKTEFKKIKLPPIKIALTGSGRVGHGATEVLHAVGVKLVTKEEFLNGSFNYPVYTQLSSQDYHIHSEGKPFDRKEFHEHPERYTSTFALFTHAADMLIAGAYWNPEAPKLFTRQDMKDSRFKIKIIADISCDINGSIPATVKATNVNDPIYDFDPINECVEPPLSGDQFITVMAIDNLPCELPRSASHDFGKDLIDKVMPSLLSADTDDIIKRATIAIDGSLTSTFLYLSDYAAGA